MTYTGNKDWFQKVAEGEIAGYSTMEKFGAHPDVDTADAPTDVWDGHGVYTFSTSADIDQISSSNTGDTQEITIIGLDASWNEVTQTKVLTGQTAATLTTPLLRVYRCYNSDSTSLAGDVYISTNGATLSSGVPTVDTTVRAKITYDNEQSLMCIYTVPAGKTGYFWGGYVAMNKSSGNYATFSWRARVFGGIFQTKSIISCVGTGSSVWTYTYKTPLVLPEKTDVVIRCEDVEANNTGVAGGFTVLLKDN